MTNHVTNGDCAVTVTLDGGELEVVFDSCYNIFNVKSDSDIMVALSPGKSEGDDGVMMAHEGDPVFYPHMQSLDRVYLKGSGTAVVFASNIAVPVFKKTRRGGDSGGLNINFAEYFGEIKAYEYIGTAEETEENT